jgi:uncharacterized membrane protein
MLKQIFFYILILFYLVAGINHFRNPDSYIKIIPTYLPFPVFLNLSAGFFEILFAVLFVFTETRNIAAWGIILMLIAFLPVHIDMILHAPMMLGKFKVTPFIAWLRIPLQGLLILWAYWYTGKQIN